MQGKSLGKGSKGEPKQVSGLDERVRWVSLAHGSTSSIQEGATVTTYPLRLIPFLTYIENHRNIDCMLKATVSHTQKSLSSGHDIFYLSCIVFLNSFTQSDIGNQTRVAEVSII